MGHRGRRGEPASSAPRASAEGRVRAAAESRRPATSDEARGGAVHRRQQQEAGGEQERHEDRLALDVGREIDERGVEGGGGARGEGDATAAEEARRERGQQERGERSDGGAGHLRQGDAVRVSEGHGCEEDRVGGRAEEVGVGPVGIDAQSSEERWRRKGSRGYPRNAPLKDRSHSPPRGARPGRSRREAPPPVRRGAGPGRQPMSKSPFSSVFLTEAMNLSASAPSIRRWSNERAR